MNKSSHISRIEPRWTVALVILVVLMLLVFVPDRIRLVPAWFAVLVGAIVLAAMIAVQLSGGKQRWLRLERSVVLTFCLVAGINILISLVYLIEEMVSGTKAINGVYLLTSSIAVGITNILVFALLYWQLDRGGPESRLNNHPHLPDWLFAQDNLPADVLPNWHPTFVDYLFLAFTTATAFSPTDTLPLSQRAKLLMMIESAIALVTIAAVASRAINILGS